MKGKNHFTSVRIRGIEAKIQKLLSIVRPFQGPPEQIYLDSADLLQLFSITAPTLRYWKEQGIIEYSRIKGKSFFQLSEVMRVIEGHRVVGGNPKSEAGSPKTEIRSLDLESEEGL